MRWLLALAASLVLVPLCGTAAVAQEDAEGSKDHPMLSRYPGYYISGYDEQEFGAYEFSLSDGTKKVEGRYWKIDYSLKDDAKKGGPIQIARNYLNAFTSRGGVKLFEDVDTGGGTVTARLPVAGKNIWMEVYVANGGEVYSLAIVEEAGMEQKVEFTAAELSKILAEKGSVAVHGILFDTGKSTIKPESASALKPIGDLLKSDAALKLEIQGHTDNVGAKAANLKLSQDRAAAVKEYLVKNFGIAADRLTSVGFGDTKPVADNASEQGRAENRRVELVRK
jgi:outer membrane protein OmpA-like peptidoglycan-associated protein